MIYLEFYRESPVRLPCRTDHARGRVQSHAIVVNEDSNVIPFPHLRILTLRFRLRYPLVWHHDA
jgi:hypothetical protein